MNKLTPLILVLLILLCASCNKTNTQQTTASKTNANENVQEEDEEDENIFQYQTQPTDAQFDEINELQSECYKKLHTFLKETNIAEILNVENIDSIKTLVHSIEYNKDIEENVLRIKIEGAKNESWIALYLNQYTMNISTEKAHEPLFYDAKLFYQMMECCLPDYSPKDEHYRKSKMGNDWAMEYYAGDYYSANRIYEITSSKDLKQAYEQLLESQIGCCLLPELPTKDYELTDQEDQSNWIYQFSPNALYIMYTHPAGASDHYYFTTNEEGTKIRVEIKPN